MTKQGHDRELNHEGFADHRLGGREHDVRVTFGNVMG
jgi:hypothetical protein